MEIVGIESKDGDEHAIATIDVWYSSRRRAWVVERLDRNGHQIGTSYRCADEIDAATCVAEWLRAHNETHLVSPREPTLAEGRVRAVRPQRRAA